MNAKVIALFAVLAVALTGGFAIVGADAADGDDFTAEYMTAGPYEGVQITFDVAPYDKIDWLGTVYGDEGTIVENVLLKFDGNKTALVWMAKPLAVGTYQVKISDRDTTTTYSGSFVVPEKFTVTFAVDDAVVKTLTVDDGDYIAADQLPEDPVKGGQEFVGWVLEGATEPFDFVNTPITQDYDFKALFKAKQYTITVDSAIENGTVTPSTSVAKMGQTITLTVTPAEGYQTVSVTVDGVAIEGNTFVMPAKDVTVSATFEAKEYTITVDPAITNGTVVADKEEAMAGETVTLTVTPAEGYQTVSVTVDGEAIEGSTFEMPAKDVTVSATFDLKEYTITVDPEIQNGTVTPSKLKAKAGEAISLTVHPAEGYQVASVTLDGVALEEYAFTMPAKDVTVSATFEAKEYTITVDPAIVNGTVVADKEKAKAGETVTLTVTADEGYEIASVTVDGKEIEEPSFTMPNKNVTVSATFELIPVVVEYTITVDSEIENGTVEADKEKAQAGETVTLTVAPAEGYQLVAVTVNGEPIEGTSFEMPAENVTVSALFVMIPVPVDDLTIEFAVATVHDVEGVYTDAEVISEYQIASEKELSMYTLVTVTGKDLKYHMNGAGDYGYWAGIFMKIVNNNSVAYDYECSKQNFGGADIGMGTLGEDTLRKYVNLDVCDALYITIVSENDVYLFKVVFDIEVDEESAYTTLTVTENFGNETAEVVVDDVPKGMPYYYEPTDRAGYVPEQAVYEVDVMGEPAVLTVQYEEHREPVAANVGIDTAKLYDPVEDILEEDLIEDYYVTIDYDLFYQTITVHGKDLREHHNGLGDMGYWAGAAFICDTPGQYYISQKSFADALAGEAYDFAAGTDRAAPSFAKYGNGGLYDTYIVIVIGDEMQFYKVTYDVTKYQKSEFMHVLYRDWLGGDRYYIYDDYSATASGSGYFLRNAADFNAVFLGWETEDGKILTAVANFDFRSGFDSKTYDRDMDAFVSDEADGLYVLTARYALNITWITFSGEEKVQAYETGQPIECPYTEQEMQDDLDAEHPEVAPGTYVFDGWEMDGTVYTPEQVDGMPANGNYVFTAHSGVASFTITFKYLNEEAEVDTIEQEVPYQETPEAPQVPQQVSDELLTYYFVGWEPEIGEVTGEATYTAVYEISVNMKEVTVTVNNEAFGYFEIDGTESTSYTVSVPVDFDVADIEDAVLAFDFAYLDHDELITESYVFTAVANPDDTRHYDFVEWQVSEDKSTYTAVFKDDILTSKDLDKILTFFDGTKTEGGDVRFTINSKDGLAIPKGEMTVCFYELEYNERLGAYMQVLKSCDAIEMDWEGDYGDDLITETIEYADLTMNGEAFDITEKDISVMWLVFEGVNGAICESNQATPGQ